MSPDEWLFRGSRYILISIQSLSISPLSLWYFAGRGSLCPYFSFVSVYLPYRDFDPSLVPIGRPVFFSTRGNYVNWHNVLGFKIHIESEPQLLHRYSIFNWQNNYCTIVPVEIFCYWTIRYRKFFFIINFCYILTSGMRYRVIHMILGTWHGRFHRKDD